MIRLCLTLLGRIAALKTNKSSQIYGRIKECLYRFANRKKSSMTLAAVGGWECESVRVCWRARVGVHTTIIRYMKSEWQRGVADLRIKMHVQLKRVLKMEMGRGCEHEVHPRSSFSLFLSFPLYFYSRPFEQVFTRGVSDDRKQRQQQRRQRKWFVDERERKPEARTEDRRPKRQRPFEAVELTGHKTTAVAASRLALNSLNWIERDRERDRSSSRSLSPSVALSLSLAQASNRRVRTPQDVGRSVRNTVYAHSSSLLFFKKFRPL